MRKISARLALGLALCAIYAGQLPWQGWAQGLLQAQLARHGVEASFRLERFSPGILALRDVEFAGLGETVESLEIHYDLSPLLGRKLHVRSFAAHWQGGDISGENISWDFARPAPLDITLHVRRMPLGAVLRMIAAGKAEGQGMVSGELPMTLYPDGGVVFKAARLSAAKGGLLRISPDAIPGEGEQVKMVQDIMRNFHYEQLSISLSGGKDEKLFMLLQLSGHNPEVYNGREVKLNVHLTGDLIPLVTQTILPSADPGEWLKQEEK